MEFFDSVSKRNGMERLERLTVTLVPERSLWAAVPAPLANQYGNLGQLPLVLQLRVLDSSGQPTRRTLHVGWYGATTQGDKLGLPRGLAQSLNLAAGTRVQVSPLPGVPAAEWVEVEPLSSSDWEVLEANAGFLEEHTAAQVGVLSKGQVLQLWGRAQAQIGLRVLAAAPADLVRITSGCEMRVAPKPRVMAEAPGGAAGAAADGGQQPQQLLGSTSLRGAAAAVPQHQQPQSGPRKRSGSPVTPAAGLRASGNGSVTGQPTMGTRRDGAGMQPALPPGLQARPTWAGSMPRPNGAGATDAGSRASLDASTAAPGVQATGQGAGGGPVAPPAAGVMNNHLHVPASMPALGQDQAEAGSSAEAVHEGSAAAAAGAAAVVAVALKLRVLPMPAGRYLLPMAGPARFDPNGSITGTSNAALEGVSSWMTTAAAVSPATARLLGQPAGALVLLHGRSTLRALAAVLVVDAQCPDGHVLLSPPVQHLLGVLPHLRLRVSTGATHGSPIANGSSGSSSLTAMMVEHPSTMPVVSLHVMPMQDPASGTPSPGASSARSGDSSPQQQGPLEAAADAQDAAASPAFLASSTAEELASAVQLWMSVQLAALQEAVLACRLPAGPAAETGAGGVPCTPLPGMPLTSGMVIHFGSAPRQSAAVAAGAQHGCSLLTAIPPGSYSLVAHVTAKAPHPHHHHHHGHAVTVHLVPADALAASPAASGLAVRVGKDPVLLPAPQYAAQAHSHLLALPRWPASLERSMAPGADGHGIAAAAGGKAHTQQMPPEEGSFLAGVSWLRPQLEQCCKRVMPALDPRVAAALARAGLPRWGGLLVTGPAGSGRSATLSTLSELAALHSGSSAHRLVVRCSQLAGSSHGAITAAMSALVTEALQCAPSLLLLDDLDMLCPASAEGSDYGTQQDSGAAGAARVADWLVGLMEEVCELQGGPVVLGASAKEAASLQAVLRHAGRFDYEVRLPAPGTQGRASMMAHALRARGVVFSRRALDALAGKAEGYEAADLCVLMDRAVHAAMTRQLAEQHSKLMLLPGAAPAPLPAAPAAATGAHAPVPAPTHARAHVEVTDEDLAAAFEGFVPAAFWGVQQAQSKAGQVEGWEDVGGMEDVVASLQEALLLPVKYSALVAGAPLRLRTGALLYGPPGCGKSHVVAAAVAAVAKVAHVRFLSVKGPELLNKYIGASEAAVRDLFQRAAAAAPAVLFFDEFDAIAPPRGHDSTGVTDRVVNQLLTELDGVEGLRGVCVLAATSRPDLIDAALLRPGRLDRLLYCGPPAGPDGRFKVLHALSRRLALAEGVDLGWVAAQADGLTGADLGAILSEAQLMAVHEHVEQQEQQQRAALQGEEAEGAKQAQAAANSTAAISIVISQEHLRRAAAAARPSLPAAERARLEALYSRFRQERDPGLAARQPHDPSKGKMSTLA